MAAGLPVIITQNIQTALIVKKYQCGKLVEFEENSIATAIKHLFINQSIYKTYSSNCLKYAPQFDWEKLIDDFYQTIISVNSTLLS